MQSQYKINMTEQQYIEYLAALVLRKLGVENTTYNERQILLACGQITQKNPQIYRHYQKHNEIPQLHVGIAAFYAAQLIRHPNSTCDPPILSQ